MRREILNQYILIGSGIAVSLLVAAFFYRELYPEYRIYQDDYAALEEFRSTYTGQPAADFKFGIKQIVLEREDKGPAVIDRCTSCHVALQIPYFSPTKLIDGPNGEKIAVKNEDYIWDRLDQEITKLKAAGAKTNKLEALKTAQVGELTYDVKKVLSMHPLIGKETRPFELHPIEEYGCTSCHNGNGRALTTDKAHGPVFDEYYEAEFTGPKPQFTESHPEKDPRFAHVFNHKPGHAMLFQTEPIFVGALIQAKCVQCHQPQKSDPVKPLLKNFQKGEELFVTQACYACHRIAAFSRGGVGPELTKEGNAYPWFIKESIVWPQADVKDSSMPNMRLDHQEIENLMTFLLAQKGPTKSQSAIDYKTQVQKWETGEKRIWEKPATSSQIYDLNYGKKIFATEGCAACHRLQGFESNIGFKIEKETDAFEKILPEQEWFKSLFPQMVSGLAYNGMPTGSELISIIEQHADEIDARIINDVRQNSLLTKLEDEHPGILESYYSNFQFALRAKEDAAWKERVHRVLMTYIQVYGLGRMIGPALNWSGIFRTDEWLMEHFRKPSLHVPRSIMPVMPFDDSKFYALTHMLDQLGIRNRDQVRKIWELNGFNPAKAYDIHCAQCHGEHMIGNGPVAEWIYPIPKNLHNNTFLKNLTKAQAIASITHGVKGTPMPPWGEVAADKGDLHIPVLTKHEIELLADWIYSTLPDEKQEVLKWEYRPEDVIEELKKEGSDLQALPESLMLGIIYKKKQMLFADFSAFISKMPTNDKVEDLFDIKTEAPDTKLYYIKEKYYTKHNIDEGRKLFIHNCAVCHGSEADGSGFRAQAMREAKPRMLTNLDWINTRDDLRLLRSIKYGVPGTSMTPWGDFTSTLQRLQMVIFIRSLSEEKEKLQALDQAIYRTFDESIFLLNQAGIDQQIKLDQYEIQLQKTQQELESEEKGDQSEAAIKSYETKLKISEHLKDYKEKLALLEALKNELRSEKEIYLHLGISLLTKTNNPLIFKQLLEIIKQNQHRYLLEDHTLIWNQSPEAFTEMQNLESELVAAMTKEMDNQKQLLNEIEGHIASAAQKEEITAKKSEIDSYQKMIDKLQTDLKTARHKAENQIKTVEKMKNGL